MKLIIGTIAALLLPITSVLAQTPISSQTLAQPSDRQFLLQVLQTYNSAAVNDIVVQAQRTDGAGQSQALTAYVLGGQSIRTELGQGDSKTVSIISNGTASSISMGKTQSIPVHMIPQHISLFPFLDMISESNNPNLQVTLRETTTLNNASVYHIQLLLADSQPGKRLFGIPLDEKADFYIDTTTLRIVRTEHMARASRDMYLQVPSISEYSDYRTVGGVLVPFHIVNTLGAASTGLNVVTTQFQSVQINGGVSPSLFQPQ